MCAVIGFFLEKGDVLLDGGCVDAVVVDQFLAQKENVFVGTVSDEIG